MSFAFSIDGTLWRVTWKGITLQHDFLNERDALNYLRSMK